MPGPGPGTRNEEGGRGEEIWIRICNGTVGYIWTGSAYT